MTTTSATTLDLGAIKKRLDAVKAKRGYLLPHHGLLSVAAPNLLAGYDAAYTAMTLEERLLPEHDKEFIWLVVLVSTEEAIATHHIKKFFNAGGTTDGFDLAVQLAGYARSAPCFAFVQNEWPKHVPHYSPARAYRQGFERLLEGAVVSRQITEIAMAAAHTCRRGWRELAWHLEGAYREKMDEFEMAEGLSYAMFPGSIPNFVTACEVWLNLIRDGRVEAGPAFKLWAETEGQGGFDEVSE
jgi:alkylhydroperoxidase/carboxymuconolactone decarboxylase family protein YurZ